MTRLWHMIRYEFTLLLRGKLALILWLSYVLYWGFTIYRYESGPVRMKSRSAIFYDHLYLITMAVMLLCGLLVMYLANKDKRTGMQTLILSWEISNTVWMAGKWLAGLSYALCYIVVTILIQLAWFVASGSDSRLYLPQHLLYTALQMGGGITLFIGLGGLLGAIVRGRISFLMLPAIWLGMVQIELGGHTSTSSVYPIWRWFSGYDLTQFKYSQSLSIWDVPLLKWTSVHQFTVLGVGILALLITLAVIQRHRLGFTEKRRILIAAAALLVPIGSLGWASFMHLKSNVAAYVEMGAWNRTTNEEYYVRELEASSVVTDFIIRENEMSVSFPKHDSLAVIGSLKLEQTVKESGSNTIMLTLNRNLKVKELRSDTPMTWQREGDTLTVRLKQVISLNEVLVLHFSYEGFIASNRGEGLQCYSFAQDQRLNLPTALGWYPQIGKRSLTLSMAHNNMAMGFIMTHPRYQEPSKTSYIVKITDGSYSHAILPINKTGAVTYRGTIRSGLFMVEGSVVERNVNGIHVIDHPDIIDQRVAEAKRGQARFSFLHEWLGVPVPLVISSIIGSTQEDSTFYEKSEQTAPNYNGIFPPQLSYIGVHQPNAMINALIIYCYMKRFNPAELGNYSSFEDYYNRENRNVNDNSTEEIRHLFKQIVVAELEGTPSLENQAAILYKKYSANSQVNGVLP